MNYARSINSLKGHFQDFVDSQPVGAVTNYDEIIDLILQIENIFNNHQHVRNNFSDRTYSDLLTRLMEGLGTCGFLAQIRGNDDYDEAQERAGPVRQRY